MLKHVAHPIYIFSPKETEDHSQYNLLWVYDALLNFLNSRL